MVCGYGGELHTAEIDLIKKIKRRKNSLIEIPIAAT
jgi:hypothetical protein